MIEEEAEKYAAESLKGFIEYIYLDQAERKIEEAVLFGYKKATEWHDLRKNPKDLPKGHKVVLNQSGMQTESDPNKGFLGFGGCGIIAWTDVPFFKE